MVASTENVAETTTSLHTIPVHEGGTVNLVECYDVTSSSSVDASVENTSKCERTKGEMTENSTFGKRRKTQLSACEQLGDEIVRENIVLPDPEEDINPDDFLVKLVNSLHGYKFEPKSAMSLQGFFEQVSEEQMAAYNNDVVAAVRNDDLDSLKVLHRNGQAMNCFNRFGESLLNMACRRGFESIVQYLLSQSNISLRHSDDCGRTVLHDACWHPQPQLEICKWILEREPVLFFVMDRRGCTAFKYARPEHWPIWRQFLLDNKNCFDKLAQAENRTLLMKKECAP